MNGPAGAAGPSVSLAQLPCIVGDMAGNVDRIMQAVRDCDPGSDLLLTPELSICGYPPEDLLGYRDFLAGCESAAADLAALAGRQRPDLHVMFGLPVLRSGRLFNSLRIVRAGRTVAEADKISLPNYGVFDEARYFTPGSEPLILEVEEAMVAVAICHDVWDPQFVQMLAGQRIDLLCVANASPFYLDKQAERERVTARAAGQLGCAVAYANYAGAQDEHIYDGGSHYLAPAGLSLRLGCEPGLASSSAPGRLAALAEPAVQLLSALVAGTRRYVGDSLPALIGISGGIDSAVTACIAVRAFGAENVLGVLMPSRHTAAVSIEGARSLAANLGIELREIDIEPAVQPIAAGLQSALGCDPAPVALENLQARIRALLLLGLANHHGSMVLTTGNKSEMATGFTTIYGDMAGAYAVLKDVSKTRVYELARLCNRQRQLIPDSIITRPPTAELRPGQLDEDSLPPYDQIDELLARIVEELASPASIAGIEPPVVADFLGRLRASEFKRRQAPVGPTVTRRAFGKDWRMPISNSFSFPDDGGDRASGC